MSTYGNNIFYMENDPTSADYDPDARPAGWYYINRQRYPIGPFSSNPQANYAAARNEPAPEVVGKIIDHITF